MFPDKFITNFILIGILMILINHTKAMMIMMIIMMMLMLMMPMMMTMMIRIIVDRHV